MSERLRHLLRDEADRIDVPPPPMEAILADARRRRGTLRTRGRVAVAASVVVVAGCVLGANQLLADTGATSSGPAAGASPRSSATPAQGTLTVSGSGVEGQPFGSDAEQVLTAVDARLGEPDLDGGPQRYFHAPGSDTWSEDAQDPLSPSWQYEYASVSCWGPLCLIFGGDSTDTLRLRGWELAEARRWADSAEVKDRLAPDVRLAGSGIHLGDSWKKLHAAYPGTVGGGGEGGSLTVRSTPWAGVSDGVGTWRLSGQWDYTRPTHVPAGAEVTRLSAGDGPEPGCC